jgi:short-subunit dehydrogenase
MTMNFRTAASLAAATVGAAAAYVALRTREESISLRGKSVLITGGSRGLGLQLARDLAEQDCRIAILARDHEELQRAQEDIEGHGANVVYYTCDVTRKDEVDEVVEQVTEHFGGGIDILINNAGIIQVGPLESLELSDFEEAMQVMFWGPLYTTLAVLPGMRERRAGHIVNVTSVGGKVSVPHLIPYCCAKFAGVALSEGLSVELRSSGINVLTVVPGLMRTGSHLGATFKSDPAQEFSWFALGATLPGISVSAEHASRAIVHAIERGRMEEIISLPANILARLHGIFPEVTLPVMRLVNDVLLPTPTRRTEAVVGREAEERLNSRLHRAATSLGHDAAEELNQPV